MASQRQRDWNIQRAILKPVESHSIWSVYKAPHLYIYVFEKRADHGIIKSPRPPHNHIGCHVKGVYRACQGIVLTSSQAHYCYHSQLTSKEIFLLTTEAIKPLHCSLAWRGQQIWDFSPGLLVLLLQWFPYISLWKHKKPWLTKAGCWESQSSVLGKWIRGLWVGICSLYIT